MNVAAQLRLARLNAGLTQNELARRAGTSQANVSAYESGRRAPSVATLTRLLSASGFRLTIEAGGPEATRPSASELRRRGRELADVLGLADAMPPFDQERELRYPRLIPRGPVTR